jgi:hypothetical protein
LAFVKVAEIGVVDDPDFGIIEKDTEVKELTTTSWMVTMAMNADSPLNSYP